MGMSPEKLEAERARLRAQKKGLRDQVTDVRTAESETAKRAKEAVKREKRSENPAKLYFRFVGEVMRKYPDANLTTHSDARFLAWGKTLLSKYSDEHLAEMIKVLVLDYESLVKCKDIFFQFKNVGPNPTYVQLQGNAEALAGLIGIGVIVPPSIRYSAYADDYNKRHNAGADGDDEDDIEAIRRQVHGQG